MGQGRKGPRDLAGDSAVQICQDDDGNALFGVVGHVRVKPDVISIMLNHQVTVHAAYRPCSGCQIRQCQRPAATRDSHEGHSA